MIKKRILYAEDDETLAFLTMDNLVLHDYEVDKFGNGKECLKAFHENEYDICLLDIMMPGMDGFTVAESIRKINEHIPIIFLSAKTLKEDMLKGLRLGADDFLVKPFSMEELILKIEKFISRAKKNAGAPKKKFSIGSFQFDPENLLLSRGDVQVQLTLMETELLKYFMDHKNEVLKREEILRNIWGQDDFFYGRSLNVFISRLRKLFSVDESVKIETLHGVGFKLIIKK
ncbi:MAG: response regulator transcription factor [Ferruginibacter sp.]